MKIAIWMLLASVSMGLAGQQPKTFEPSIKATAAASTLVDLAKTYYADKTAFEVRREIDQAKIVQGRKQALAEYDAAAQALMEKLRKDRRYKGDIEHMDNLRSQLVATDKDSVKTAELSLRELQQKLRVEEQGIEKLVEAVRAENALPSRAQFAADTQKWSVSAQ